MPGPQAAPALIADLRSHTRALHSRLEAGAFARSIADGTLERASYRAFLSAMSVLHGALEGALESTRLIPGLARSERRARLARDLAHLHAPDLPEGPRAALTAQVLAAKLRVASSVEPHALIGWLYVLEGAALGNLAVREQVNRALKLGGRGLEFLGGEGKATRARFEACVKAIDAAAVQPGDRQRVIRAAQDAFEGVESLLAAVVPLDPTPVKELVCVLNREAGRHAIAGDLRELVAALEAGEQSWSAAPYYAARYGERGLRFTRSDSGWLAALGRCETGHVLSQVQWLSGVLAARGMPSVLLEDHLRVLHRALSAALPGYPSALLAAAERLASDRSRHLSEDDLAELGSRFDESVEQSERERLPGTGRLLSCAVADEAGGRMNAVSSLEAWLVDPARFSARWIQAVHQLLVQARARIGQ